MSYDGWHSRSVASVLSAGGKSGCSWRLPGHAHARAYSIPPPPGPPGSPRGPCSGPSTQLFGGSAPWCPGPPSPLGADSRGPTWALLSWLWGLVRHPAPRTRSPGGRPTLSCWEGCRGQVCGWQLCLLCSQRQRHAGVHSVRMPTSGSRCSRASAPPVCLLSIGFLLSSRRFVLGPFFFPTRPLSPFGWRPRL